MCGLRNNGQRNEGGYTKHRDVHARQRLWLWMPGRPQAVSVLHDLRQARGCSTRSRFLLSLQGLAAACCYLLDSMPLRSPLQYTALPQ